MKIASLESFYCVCHVEWKNQLIHAKRTGLRACDWFDLCCEEGGASFIMFIWRESIVKETKRFRKENFIAVAFIQWITCKFVWVKDSVTYLDVDVWQKQSRNHCQRPQENPKNEKFDEKGSSCIYHTERTKVKRYLWLSAHQIFVKLNLYKDKGKPLW